MDSYQIRTQILVQAGTLLGGGPVVGSLAGIAAVLFGNTPDGTAAILAAGYLVLGGVLGILLLLTLWLSQDNSLSIDAGHKPRSVYTSLWWALLVTTTASLAGVIGASFTFLFPAFGFPGLFKGLGTAEFQQAVLGRIGINGFLFVLGLTLLMGLTGTLMTVIRVKNS